MTYLIKLLKWMSVIVLLGIVFVIATDYAPEAIVEQEVINRNAQVLSGEESLKIGIFNIGFAGLDKDQDFFMDGGTGSRPESKEKVLSNMEKVATYMQLFDQDVYIVQEVDVESARSYKINERSFLEESLPAYNTSGTSYYKVPFVPVPINLPLGKVDMELVTFSKGKINQAIRHRLPSIDTLPDKYFHLDRCMFESVIPLDNGKNLVVLNVHLSAYDSNGTIKTEQLEWIERYIEEADLDNNYYIFGGDWNLIMTDTSNEDPENLRDYWVEKPKNFKDGGFTWVYDDRVNTVRELDAPYIKGQTYERVIDGYLVSPNIEVVEVETVDLGFEFSDHNPVNLEINLK